MKRFILFIFFSCFSILIFSQINQNGIPFIQNYTIKDYNAYSQNWATVENEKGILYFANNDGVLEYDGVNWNLIPINNEAIVKSLFIDSKGIIYVGAENEFGYISPNETGKLFYTSLSSSLKKEDARFSSIYKIYKLEDEIMFCANKKIFIYKDDNIKTIILPKGGFFTHKVGGQFYMGDYYKGLMILENNKFVECEKGEFYAKKDIMGAFSHSKNEILIATANDGLYIYNTKTRNSKHPNNKDYEFIHPLLAENYLYNGIKNKNSYTFITIYGGIFKINNEFKIIEKYNYELGIQDQLTFAGYENLLKPSTSPLWLSLNNGIAKVENSSAFRCFNKKNGLEAEVLSIAEFNNKIFLGTSNGIVYIDITDSLSVPKFTKIENTEGQCWNFAVNKNNLFISSFNIFHLTNQKVNVIKAENQVFKLLFSEINKNILYAGREKGLSIYKLENNNLKFFSNIPDFNEFVLDIDEDENGDLWVTNSANELIKISFNDKDTTIVKFNNEEVFKENKFLHCFKYKKYLFFSTDKDLLFYDNEIKKLKSEKYFSPEIHKELINLKDFRVDKDGNIWVVLRNSNTDKLKFIKNEGGILSLEKNGSSRLSNSIILDIYPDKNGILWIASPDGLFTFNTHNKFKQSKPYYTIIREIVDNKDSIISYGIFKNNKRYSYSQQKINIPEFKHSENSLTFHFAAPFFIEEKEIKFQTFLEGFDVDWSKPTGNTFKEYTNLYEGTYIFKVKAKNIYNIESEVAEYIFTISPPWYRTILAYFLYFILGIVLIWIIVKLNTRRLEKDKEILEGIVKERTAEIVQQKEEIQAQADNLQDANHEITQKNSILKIQKAEIEDKNHHITSSIEYASRIQHALLTPHEVVSKYLPEHFILFKPRDIVSGDFYWLKQIGNHTIYAAADCTGHGVPGAFMSMLGISFLNEIITKTRFDNAGEILDKLRKKVKISLRQTGKDNESKDGMDIAICIIDNDTHTVEYAGAYNPLYILRKGELIEIKPTRNPIGIYLREKPFENHKFQLEKDDVLYTFSDGYVDQFGGENERKFKTKNFKNLLVEIYDKPMSKQKKILEEVLLKWQGNVEQTDDIIVFGVKI